MSFSRTAAHAFAAASLAGLFACSDSSAPSEPSMNNPQPSTERSPVAQDRLAAMFGDVSQEVMALPGTVYANHDAANNKLVFAVENEHAIPGVRRSLEARGLAAGEFEIKVTKPIV